MCTLQTIGIIVGVVSGVSGLVLGILNYLHQRDTTRPRIVVRPRVGEVHHSQTGWEKNVPFMEVCNVGQVPVIGATIGFLGRRGDDKPTIISKLKCITDVEWPGELKPQHVAVLRFDLDNLPEACKLGRAFAMTIVGDEFKASRRDMRIFATQRKAAST
ncbi:MAG: hypothetical protein NTZ17_01080 [Phycisphaerae bacterium]|nr:hypothetical protein [Phycisphaerae bacterium]